MWFVGTCSYKLVNDDLDEKLGLNSVIELVSQKFDSYPKSKLKLEQVLSFSSFPVCVFVSGVVWSIALCVRGGLWLNNHHKTDINI